MTGSSRHRCSAAGAASAAPPLHQPPQRPLTPPPPPVPARSWLHPRRQPSLPQPPMLLPALPPPPPLLPLPPPQPPRAASCPLQPADGGEKSRRNYSPVNHIPPCRPLTACQLVQSAQQAKRRRRHWLAGFGARRRSHSQGGPWPPLEQPVSPPPLPLSPSPPPSPEKSAAAAKPPSLRAKLSRLFRRTAAAPSSAPTTSAASIASIPQAAAKPPPSPPPPRQRLPPPPPPLPSQPPPSLPAGPSSPPQLSPEVAPVRRTGFSPVHLLQRPPRSGSTAFKLLVVPPLRRPLPSSADPDPLPDAPGAARASAADIGSGVASADFAAHHPQPTQTPLRPAPAPLLPQRPPPRLPPRSRGGGTASRQSGKLAMGFLENLSQLKRKQWYFGPLSSTDAEDMLNNRPDGTFLVRDSAHDSYIVSLSFRARGQTYHTRIEHNKGKFSFWSQPENHSASTIVEFIESAVAYSKTENFHYFLSSSTPGTPPIQVSMLYPLSRFTVMTSLRHRCRFEILARTRRDHIDRLPLPPADKLYLQEKQYFIECREDFVCPVPQPPPPAQLQPEP